MLKLVFVVAFLCATVFISRQADARQMLGGRREYDMTNVENKKKIDELVEYGLSKLAEYRLIAAAENQQNKQFNENKKELKYSPIEVTRVQTQVVAGIKYIIQVKFREANNNGCSGGNSECVNSDFEDCELSIWVKPWENFQNLTEVNCRKQAMTVGGKQRISVKSKQAQNALHHAVLKMNAESDEKFYSRPVQIDRAYKQIVNGIKYIIVFKYAPTECNKNVDERLLTKQELDECKIAESSKPLKCRVVVLDKPWLERSTGTSLKDELETSTSRYKLMNKDCQEDE